MGCTASKAANTRASPPRKKHSFAEPVTGDDDQNVIAPSLLTAAVAKDSNGEAKPAREARAALPTTMHAEVAAASPQTPAPVAAALATTIPAPVAPVVAPPTSAKKPSPPQTSPDRLVNYRGLVEAFRPLQRGGVSPMVLLKASWVRQQAKKLRAAQDAHDEATVRLLAFKRRQDMPKEAFVEPHVLDSFRPIRIQSNNDLRFPIGAVSYAWETPDHPDPVGHSLLTIADALEDCYSKYGESGTRTFPEQFGLFMDFPCLFQNERTAEEKELFKFAMKNLDHVYAHRLTTVWLLTNSAPPTRPSYADSGWTTYESLGSRILKQNANNLQSCWPAVIDLGDPDKKKKVPAPLPIAEFNERVKTLHFTNGADRSFVAGLYETMLQNAFGSATELWFIDCEWGDAEMVQFSLSLDLCTRLTFINLKNNKFGAVGMAEFARALRAGAAPKLQSLYMQGMDLSAAAVHLTAIQAARPSLDIRVDKHDWKRMK